MIYRFIIIALMGVSLAVTYQETAFGEPAKSVEKRQNLVLEDYIKVQEALAMDSLEGVKEASARMSKNSKHKDIKAAASRLGLSKNLKEARESFKALSSAVAPSVDRTDATYEVYSCSMANAKWVQRKGAVANPYYGSEMATCGEKVN